MKSLEIVNERIESTLKAEDKLKMELQLCFYKDEANCIKQDLEVLEILKKYLYIVENQIPRTDDYFEVLETDLDEMQDDENCDDFHKVKQWLEENENE